MHKYDIYIYICICIHEYFYFHIVIILCCLGRSSGSWHHQNIFRVFAEGRESDGAAAQRVGSCARTKETILSVRNAPQLGSSCSRSLAGGISYIGLGLGTK